MQVSIVDNLESINMGSLEEDLNKYAQGTTKHDLANFNNTPYVIASVDRIKDTFLIHIQDIETGTVFKTDELSVTLEQVSPLQLVLSSESSNNAAYIQMTDKDLSGYYEQTILAQVISYVNELG